MGVGGTMSENKLPWRERVNAISVNPEMATREDVLRMAAELSAQPKEKCKHLHGEMCTVITPIDGKGVNECHGWKEDCPMYTPAAQPGMEELVRSLEIWLNEEVLCRKGSKLFTTMAKASAYHEVMRKIQEYRRELPPKKEGA